MQMDATVDRSAAGDREALWKGRLLAVTFAAWLAGSTLSAYEIGGVPIDWITRGLALGVGALVALSGKMRRVPGSGPLALLFCWALVITLSNGLLEDYAHKMPPTARLSYTAYVSLRFTNLLAFVAVLYLTYGMLHHGRWAAMARTTVWIGTLVSLVAVYVYLAQTWGLPELPRNRLGTSGGAPAVTFTGGYTFHRAMGTFREPGDLADWLIVPLFLSLACRGGSPSLHTLVMASVLLLTGSLAGIVGAGIGLVGAILVANPFRARSVKTLLSVGRVVLLGLVVFAALAHGYRGQGTDLLGLLKERLEPFFGGGGIMETNRGYIYGAAFRMPFSLFGFGLGNANLEFTRHVDLHTIPLPQRTSLIVSFISLYLYIWFSTGLPGAVLLFLFLARPLARLLRSRLACADGTILPLHAAYLTYLVIFPFRSEEMPLSFALLYALLTHAIEKRFEAPAATPA